jgi:ribosomal protein S18 acetylase RimI-like enzyme
MSDSGPWEQERAALLSRLAELKPIVRPIKNPPAVLRVALAQEEEALCLHRITQAAFAELRGVLQPPSGAEKETVEDIRAALREGGAVLAWIGDAAVSSARFHLLPDHLYVGRLGVLPDHRGRGIASVIMEYLERIAICLDRSEIRLGTRMRLPKNLAIYQRLGYEIVEVRAHPRGPDQIALLVKRLPRNEGETV